MKKEKAEKQLNSLIEKAITESGYDQEKAVNMIWREINSNQALKNSVLDLLLIKGIKQGVYSYISVNRSSIWNKETPKGVSGEALQKRGKRKAAESNVKDTIMMMWMKNAQKPLGSCTRDDLAKEIQVFADHAKWNEEKRSFLASIHENIYEDQTVQDRYTETQLEKMRDNVKKKVGAQYRDKYPQPEYQKEIA
jgi:hypothetical protein